MKYKVLIVGLGNIAVGYDLHDTNHCDVRTHAKAFKIHDNFSLGGGVDCNVKSCQLFEDNYQLPSYSDLDDALIGINPDLVVISTPTSVHLENIRTIVKYCNVKVVLCEKPLSYDIKEAQEIVRLCNFHKIQLYVNYIRRADPAVIELKEWFDSEKIKKPIKGVVWYSKGLIHNGSHFVDLLKLWFGSIQSSCIIGKGQNLPQGDIEIDFKLNFENVSIVFLSAQEDFFSHYTIELITPDGRIRYDKGGRQVIWNRRSDSFQLNQARTLSDNEVTIESDLSNYQMNIVTQLNKAINNQNNSLCTGKQALELSNDIFSIIKKSKTCLN